MTARSKKKVTARSKKTTAKPTPGVPSFVKRYRGHQPLPRPVEIGQPNEAVPLFAGQLEVLGTPSTRGDGSVELRWVPTPRVQVLLPSFVRGLDSPGDTPRFRLANGWEFEALVTSLGDGGLQAVVAERASGWFGGPERPLSHALFVLPNFLETRGGMIRSSRTSRYSGRQVCEFDGWKLTIDLLPKDPQKRLRTTGGYALTHAAKLARQDGREFTLRQLDPVVTHLRWILSFVRGAWTAPLLVTGYDASGAAWQEWANWVLDDWRGRDSWFPAFAPLDGILGPMASLLSRGGSRTITTCIHWYVEANKCSGGVEGALVMALTAMERLAWYELVLHRRCVSRDGFEKLAASDKIATLLSILGIPLSIPAALPSLTAEGKAKSWTNGVVALCQLRNRVVHPPKNDNEPELASAIAEEIWRYSLHLLELALLRISGFEGEHQSRVARSTVPVPWMAARPTAPARSSTRRTPSR